jgi:hypothetical protein
LSLREERNEKRNEKRIKEIRPPWSSGRRRDNLFLINRNWR